ncbi:MAG TPA: hypothetical protein VH599_11190 [Ktedonobacterales bacterium]|jgi:ABC-type Fe3+ transport system permease subunit
MPTTIPAQPPDTLLIISAIAVICVALLFAERYAMRRQMRDATVSWPQRIANLLRGVGIWWLVLGSSAFLIFLVVYVVMRYQENANGDLSTLLSSRIFPIAAWLALVVKS